MLKIKLVKVSLRHKQYYLNLKELNCPYCESKEVEIVDGEGGEDYDLRTYECRDCKKEFSFLIELNK